jgi:N-acetylneuraminic acid mutarotase
VLIIDSLKWERIEYKSIHEPSPRIFITMVCLDNRLFVYGGRHKKERNDELWEFDLSRKQWTELHLKHPRPGKLTGHQGAVMELENCTLGFVMFGGDDGNSKNNDLWQLEIGK